MKNYIYVLSLCLIGCGGTEFTTADAIDNVGGEKNADGGAGSDTGGTNSGGDTGSVSSTGGEPSVGGVLNTGGAVTTGGTGAGGASTGGVVNTGGGSGCVPKTCTQLAQAQMNDVTSVDACNVWPDDGCGNAIDCGGCERVGTHCGGTILHGLHYPEHRFNSNSQTVYEANTNVCSTGCIYYSKDTFTCGAINGLPGYAYMHCTTSQDTPPQDGCVAATEGSTKDWCCNGAVINHGTSTDTASRVRVSDANPQ